MAPKALRTLHNLVYPAAELLLGMVIAQIVAALQVHASNLRLFEQMSAAADAGFVPVPNRLVLPALPGWEAAFAGGLLFTLSVGAGIALLTVAVAAGWPGRAAPRRGAAALALGLWFGTLLLFNIRGFDPYVSLYLLCIPPPVFIMASRRPGDPPAGTGRRWVLTRVLPVILLALVWLTQYDRNLFIDLRDHLLMSNPVGERVYSFYYRYTLHPAEVFKRLDQKQLRTVTLQATAPETPVERVAAGLIRNDYLPVAAGSAADLDIQAAGDRLVFARQGKQILEVAAEQFAADPAGVLKEASDRTDRFAVFRSFTFACVLLAFPVALWIMLFALARAAAEILAAGRRAEILAAGACLLLGLGLWGWFYAGREPPPPADGLAAALKSPRWQVRVAALKTVPERQVDIGANPALSEWAVSPHPQERYWLARALGRSRRPEAAAALTRLLEDPNLNVQTMAIEALARQGNRRAVSLVLQQLEKSNEWYVQFYAYRALKELGWQQRASH
jgi:HEAT repeat protein